MHTIAHLVFNFETSKSKDYFIPSSQLSCLGTTSHHGPWIGGTMRYPIKNGKPCKTIRSCGKKHQNTMGDHWKVMKLYDVCRTHVPKAYEQNWTKHWIGRVVGHGTSWTRQVGSSLGRDEESAASRGSKGFDGSLLLRERSPNWSTLPWLYFIYFGICGTFEGCSLLFHWVMWL